MKKLYYHILADVIFAVLIILVGIMAEPDIGTAFTIFLAILLFYGLHSIAVIADGLISKKLDRSTRWIFICYAFLLIAGCIGFFFWVRSMPMKIGG